MQRPSKKMISYDSYWNHSQKQYVQRKIIYKNGKKNLNSYEEYHYHDGGTYAVELKNGKNDGQGSKN
jgi:hypothetical protein